MAGELTVSMQNYLEIIFELDPQNGGARVSDIAEKAGVSKASVCRAMSVLSQNEFVRNGRYSDIFLTEEGIKQAKLLHFRHSTLERFFVEVLKLDKDIASVDACAIEHVINPKTVDAIARLLEKTTKE